MITTILVPLLFFVVLEFGLRLAGVGKSYEYFHEIDIDGQPHYQENPDFADQFYPESLDIRPKENTFSAERSPELLRVYILGGSAAQGFPHKNHGLDRLLAAQLRAAFPTRKIEVINTAMTSVNSHVVYAVAQSIPEDSADFAVILMGNNEVVGPYGPGTFNQNFLSNLTAIRGIQALKRTRLWQALDSLLLQSEPEEAKEELKWQGMQMFTDFGVTYDDPRMESVYGHYETNLRDIVATLQDKGIHALVSSVPVNLRHSAPFLSEHSPELTASDLEQWTTLNEKAKASYASGNWKDTASLTAAALDLDPDYADTHFRMANAYEKLDMHRGATRHYRQALDKDALRFRADSRINQAVKDVATSGADTTLSFVDSAAAFEAASQPYQPGWNLLLEHVHYSFSGNHILAAEITRTIKANLNAGDDYRPLTEAEVANRVGFPNFDSAEAVRTLQAMVQHPPFPGQSNYDALKSFLSRTLQELTREVGSAAAVVQRRRSAVRSGTADWKVHFELAVLAKRMGDRPAMYRHLTKIIQLYPHNRETYMNLAEAYSEDRQWPAAIQNLERSLYYTRGDAQKIAETLIWLGSAHFEAGDNKKGKELLLQVTDEYSDQIFLTLQSYGNLIKYARSNRQDIERYAKDVHRYAEALIRDGRGEEYPLLNKRMSQLMAMAGYPEKAQEWAARP